MKLFRFKSHSTRKSALPAHSLNFLVFRSALAVALLFTWLHLLPGLREILTSAGFHLSREASSGTGYFSLPPLEAALYPAFITAVLLSLLLLAMGVVPRTMAALAAAALGLLVSIDPTSSSAHLKIGILALVLIAIVSRRDLALAWPVQLGKILLVSVYFLAGWKKAVFGDWLERSHGLESILRGGFQTGLASALLGIFPSWIWSGGQIAVIVFQLLAPFLFLNPGTRKTALLCGCLFHIAIALMLKDMIFFSLLMLSFYPLFLPFSGLRAQGQRAIGAFYLGKP